MLLLQENSDRYFLAVTALYGVGWNVLLKVHSSLLQLGLRRARLKQVPNKVLGQDSPAYFKSFEFSIIASSG